MAVTPMIQRSSLLACATAIGLGVAVPAAAELGYGFDAGIGYSDNITRVPADEIDETIATAGVNLNWQENRPRLDGDVNVDMRYFDYLDDTYDSEVVGTADADLLFQLIPDRLGWLVHDSFGQMNEDPFSPITPENREDVNYFTTGPDLTLNLGQTGRLRMFGYYSINEYETSPLDGSRLTGGLMLGRALSAASQVGINATAERIEFDDVEDQDYDRNNLFVSYRLEGDRTQVSVEAGYTWLKPEVDEEWDGPLLRAEIIRQVTAASSVSLSFGTQITDASDALRSSMDGPNSGTDFITASPEPFESRNASLGWNFNRNRTTASANVSWVEDRYETQTLLNRTTILWNASVERRITPRITAGLLASLNDDEFDTAGGSADELRVGATLNWRMGRSVGLRLLLERYDRDSSDGLGEYDENRGFLTVTYSRGENGT